jgi:hypothetical protein
MFDELSESRTESRDVIEKVVKAQRAAGEAAVEATRDLVSTTAERVRTGVTRVTTGVAETTNGKAAKPAAASAAAKSE